MVLSLLRCPFCHDGVGALRETVICARCLARHHGDCWGELGRCSSCREAAPLVVPRSVAVKKRSWRRALVVGAGLAMLGLCLLAMLIPGHHGCKKWGGEASAIGTLRTIQVSQAIYKERSGEYAPSLKALEGLVDPVLAGGVKMGYGFGLYRSPDGSFVAWAHPIRYQETGDRSFFLDATGVIRYEVGKPAGPTSIVVGK